MILTGQAKKDFEKWYRSTNSVEIYGSDKVFNTIQNALIIEWFDTVGIYVNAIKYYNHWTFIVRLQYNQKYKKRQEALEAGIAKANEIYNFRVLD